MSRVWIWGGPIERDIRAQVYRYALVGSRSSGVEAWISKILTEVNCCLLVAEDYGVRFWSLPL